jgi:hypothetical protein
MELVSMYARYTNWILGPFAVLIKLGYKSASRTYFAVIKARAEV